MAYKVLISNNVIKELEKRGATKQQLTRLATTVVNYKREAELTMDSSDNVLSYMGYPLSFVRDHTNRKAYIITNGEALDLDTYMNTLSQ